jgi:D-cysteine desulfhydrase
MQKVADTLKAKGKTPYIIPGGASNTIGATGYVACAQETLQQLFDMGIKIDHMVVPSGSAGTHAGIVVGMQGNNAGIPVSGINVSRTKADQEALVYKLVEATAEHVGVAAPIAKDAVECFDGYVGPGYSLPTDSMVEAVKLLASTEAILLDPVYSGKAMAGLIDLVRKGHFPEGSNVLFLHTGGSPALYAYQKVF